ncbi:unnamed protein product [Umbelopsis vinacea]
MEDQMRAWVYTKPGRPENILSLANVPKPKLTSPNQVLVKVSHTSLFSSNVAIMALVPNPAGTPRIPEMEFAGTVVALGENVRADLKQSGPGIQVWGLTLPMENKLEVINHMRKPNGTLTEYIVGIKSGEGDYVLINGGSGAVGILLLQIAKEIVGPSGKVVTTCSGEKFDLVKQHGADIAIDYRAQDPVHEYLMREYSTRKFDAIIDTASSQELYDHSPAYLNSGKLFLDMAVKHPVDRDWRATDLLWFMCNQVKNNFQPRWLGGTQTKYKFISATPTLKSLERLRKLIAEGKLRGPVDSVWSMDQAIPAYERFLSHKAKGRVVIEVQKFNKANE